jgi:PAS domain S-box-containing protein
MIQAVARGMVEMIRANAALLDALPDGILVADGDGRIAFCNTQLETLSGYPSAELVGKPIETLVPDRLHSEHLQHRDGYFASGMPIRAMGSGLKIHLRTRDGREIPVDISLAPLESEEGRLVMAAVRDATEHTRIEQELRDSRERFQLLINGVEDYAIFMLDPEGRVASWNSGAENIKGYTAEEILGRPHSVFYTAEDVKAGVPQRGLELAAEQRTYQVQGWRVRKDGHRFWAEIVITAMRDESGKLRGFSKVTRDSTFRKLAQDRMAAVIEIGAAILTGGNSEELLALVANRARTMVDAATAVIAMARAGGDELQLLVVDGEGAESLREVRVRADAAVGEGPDISSAMGAVGLAPPVLLPLVAETRQVGLLAIANRQGSAEFSADERQVMELFAAQAAVAIQYDRARDELRRLDLMDERERIGRELHDGVIQSLFAVGMNLQAAAARAGNAELEQRLEGSAGEIDRAIRDLRNYIFGLRPGILADRQLAQAIESLAANFERESGVTIVAEIDGQVAARLASQAGDIVQLVRESLSNVARHAGATTCRVSLSADDGQAMLEIDDDGQGFDRSAVSGSGQGLRNLGERAASMGAHLEIHSRAGEGTTVRIRLPL